MCAERKRIESKLVCLLKKVIQKKLRLTLLQQILNTSHVD